MSHGEGGAGPVPLDEGSLVKEIPASQLDLLLSPPAPGEEAQEVRAIGSVPGRHHGDLELRHELLLFQRPLWKSVVEDDLASSTGPLPGRLV
ncbi:hypothetical protein N7466_008714 [Penicillium verhagenii]|uniref:uncharacterized protein n=1 Tax=Penicillium verhagenii TaxID=1562060 RepID=UPI00254521CB|nr:uncharacterized protein N7466_008714 [Penicillium verhagenii]KAJ5924527.1 hypothetical protein N7466_008714 [Penicillium verhagenii]